MFSPARLESASLRLRAFAKVLMRVSTVLRPSDMGGPHRRSAMFWRPRMLSVIGIDHHWQGGFNLNASFLLVDVALNVGMERILARIHCRSHIRECRLS